MTGVGLLVLRRRRPLMLESLERRLLLTHSLALPSSYEAAEGESTTQVRFRMEATDLAGTPITTTLPGNDFYLAVWVSDARAVTSSAGVYAAFLDVAYDDELLTVAASSSNPLGFDIEFGEKYQNGRAGKAEVAGLIDEVGAFQLGLSPLGAGEFLLFRVRFNTGGVQLHDDAFAGVLEDSGPVELDVLANDQIRGGNALFSGNSADVRPAHDVLLFSPPTVVANDAKQFLGTELAITDVGQQVITHVSVPLAGGVVRVSDDGQGLFYTPAPNFSGTDTFTYMVGESGIATVTVMVEPVNDAPLALDDLYSVGYQEPLVADVLRGVLSNDHDAEGDTLSAQIVQDAAFGSLVLHADGSFDYVPNDGFRGRDQFTYVAQDGELSSSAATVLIDVGTPQVGMRLEVTDASGQNVDRLAGAASLWLRVWVQDVRDGRYLDRGVFAAYFDLLYDAQYVLPRLDAALPRGFEIDFGTEFNQPGSGDASAPGVVDEVGSFATSFLPLGSDERLLFEMPFDIASPRLAEDRYDVSLQSQGNILDVLTNDLALAWTAEFTPQAADVSPDHDVLLFEPPQAVPADQIVFTRASIELTNEASLTIVAVSATQAGGLAAMTADKRQVLYTPPAGFTGTDTFTYTVSDSRGRQAEATVVVDVIPSWQNVRNPLDVNGDTFISPIDVLLVISDLNHNGARSLVDPAAGPPFLDVNGDGNVSPIDALHVINYLNGGEGEGESDVGEPRVATSLVAALPDTFVPGLLALPEGEAVVSRALRVRRPTATSFLSPAATSLAAARRAPHARSTRSTSVYREWGRQAWRDQAAVARDLLALDELLELWDGDRRRVG